MSRLNGDCPECGKDSLIKLGSTPTRGRNGRKIGESTAYWCFLCDAQFVQIDEMPAKHQH